MMARATDKTGGAEDTKKGTMWRVMRTASKMGRAFTVGDLVKFTECSRCSAYNFIWHLSRAGVIRPVGRGSRGLDIASRGRKAWRLALDLGPKVPLRRKGGLWDANSGAFVESAKTSEKQTRRANHD